jgi:hypothetical protein
MLCSHEFSACPIEPGLGRKRKAFDGGSSLRWEEEPALHLASAVAGCCMLCQCLNLAVFRLQFFFGKIPIALSLLFDKIYPTIN